VEIGTASYADPRAVERLAKGLETWCSGNHVQRVSELTGGLRME
jgi:dihydroorotate dehydrogenase (NAD+) catalytic subunit